MTEYPLRARFLYAALICILALPIAGWASGQSRFATAPATLSADGSTTVMLSALTSDRSGRAGSLMVEMQSRSGTIRARRDTVLKVTAVDGDGILVRNAELVVDWGDGRSGKYAFDRRALVRHTWRQAGSYKIKFRLVDSAGEVGTGKLRVRVGKPTHVFFEILGEDKPELDAQSSWSFVAIEREARKVAGVLTVDWGDGTPSTVVKNFAGQVNRAHTYVDEGDYTITGSIDNAATGATNTTTLAVAVSETGGPIDLRDASIASNSAQSIARFAITSVVTKVTINGTQICIFHTKAGKWPVKNSLEGNPWVAAYLDGKLYAGTYEWLRPGQVCKGIKWSNIGEHVKFGPLARWFPKPGEISYFFTSTHARLGSRTSDQASLPVAKAWPPR